MKNLLNFFFSFDKLFKEKLIVPAFWLAIIYYGLKYLVQAVDAVQLDPLNWFIGPVGFIAKVLFTLLAIRIVAELVVAIFRINDNLSPDKGKSELANIDPMAEARKAAELAANRTREATKSVSEKASAATKSVRNNVDEMTDTVQAKAKSVTQSSKEKTESIMGKGSVPHPDQDPTPVKILEPSAADMPKKQGQSKEATSQPKTSTAPKKRGRPAGSKNKTKTATSSARTKTAPKKRGPKPGSKAPRDAEGNLLKKDGTPRKKPGPKTKS